MRSRLNSLTLNHSWIKVREQWGKKQQCFFFLIPSTDSKEILVQVACRRLCAQESKHFHSENKWFTVGSTGHSGERWPHETRGRLFSTTDSMSGEVGSEGLSSLSPFSGTKLALIFFNPSSYGYCGKS